MHAYYLVDDDPAVLRMMQRIIEQERLGRVLGTAQDGRSAQLDLVALAPNVVVIDLLMPGQDGIQTIRNLQAKGFSGLFVMLSHVTDKEMVAQAYEAGVQFYISKPLNLIEIVSVLTGVNEKLSMRQALASIQNTLLPLYRNERSPRGAEEPVAPRRQTALRILTDLGILGEAGAEDLLALADLPVPPVYGQELHRLYEQLAQHSRRTARPKSSEVRSIEQRLRRAALSALSNMAALGLEDFGDPRFERLASTFFDFVEIRVEMNRLRQNSRGPTGRVNMKKFLAAFVLAIEEGLHV